MHQGAHPDRDRGQVHAGEQRSPPGNGDVRVRAQALRGGHHAQRPRDPRARADLGQPERDRQASGFGEQELPRPALPQGARGAGVGDQQGGQPEDPGHAAERAGHDPGSQPREGGLLLPRRGGEALAHHTAQRQRQAGEQ